ncbi:hypothetical protein CHS0354_042334, partial [Potamilus streckersoni]
AYATSYEERNDITTKTGNPFVKSNCLGDLCGICQDSILTLYAYTYGRDFDRSNNQSTLIRDMLFFNNKKKNVNE